ncbi:PTS sugar transporter subunit IIA [Fusobacterium sp. PH5-44]|uniref:PTS sugar transporter subunit IIA n=1 Tax=unclassified Fusobacterium TaxID=2648384 RepID=UPI003D1A2AE6
MKFASYLNSDFIFTDIIKGNIDEIIKEMIEKIAVQDKKIKVLKDTITHSVLKRENEISTNIGSGIAVPHGRLEDFNDFIISICVLPEPIQMEIASTGKFSSVNVIFLVLCDVLKNKNILKMMSAISKLGLNNKEILSNIILEKSPNKILELIQSANIEVGDKIIAEDVLSPDIIPATPNDTLEFIAKRLILEEISGLPVVNEDNNFLGEITERELISFGMPDYLSYIDNLNFLTVGEPFEEYLKNEKTTTIENLYRKKEVPIIDKKTPIMEICALIIKKGITRFYVVEKGKYIGMIKRADIIKKILHI